MAPADSSWTWLWVVLLLAVVALTLVAGWWLWQFRGWGPDFGQPRRNRSGKLAGTVRLARTRVDVQSAPRRRRFLPGTRLVNPWGEPSLARLIDLGPEIRPQLSDCPLMLRWPSDPVLGPDGLLVSTHFIEPQGPCVSGRAKPARLDALIGRSAGPVLDPTHLWDIATWIGRLVAQMHEAGWAIGTFDWQSFHYCDQPTPHLHVTGIERARELGSEAAFALVPDKSWADPRDSAILASFEQDRYRYALLIHRLLLASEPGATLGRQANSRSSARTNTDSSATSARDYRSLRDLAGRAAGQLYERPTIAEWLAVLQRRDWNLALQRIGPNPVQPTPHSPEYFPGDIR